MNRCTPQKPFFFFISICLLVLEIPISHAAVQVARRALDGVPVATRVADDVFPLERAYSPVFPAGQASSRALELADTPNILDVASALAAGPKNILQAALHMVRSRPLVKSKPSGAASGRRFNMRPAAEETGVTRHRGRTQATVVVSKKSAYISPPPGTRSRSSSSSSHRSSDSAASTVAENFEDEAGSFNTVVVAARHEPTMGSRSLVSPMETAPGYRQPLKYEVTPELINALEKDNEVMNLFVSTWFNHDPDLIAKVPAGPLYTERDLYTLMLLGKGKPGNVNMLVLVPELPTEELINYYIGLGLPEKIHRKGRKAVKREVAARRQYVKFIAEEWTQEKAYVADSFLKNKTKVAEAQRYIDAVERRTRVKFAELVNVNTREADERLAAAFGLTPIEASTHAAKSMGTKSASRKVFEAAARTSGGAVQYPQGVPLHKNFTTLAHAIAQKSKSHGITEWMIKLDVGASGVGNHHISLKSAGVQDPKRHSIPELAKKLEDMLHDDLPKSIHDDIPRQGAIAEEFIEGAVRFPSAQFQGRRLISTHDQIVEANGNYLGASYPSQSEEKIRRASQAIANTFNQKGHFGIDYIETADGRLYALELNVRKTGTTHPYEGTFLALNGDMKGRFYTSYDNMKISNPEWEGISGDDVIRALKKSHLKYNHKERVGVTVHLTGMLKRGHKMGATFIGRTREEVQLYEQSFKLFLDQVAYARKMKRRSSDSRFLRPTVAETTEASSKEAYRKRVALIRRARAKKQTGTQRVTTSASKKPAAQISLRSHVPPPPWPEAL